MRLTQRKEEALAGWQTENLVGNTNMHLYMYMYIYIYIHTYTYIHI